MKIIQTEIARSFSQKKNLGNYETQDYFASYKVILEGEPNITELQEASDKLSERAENDVMSKIDPTKFISRQQTLAEYRAKLKSQEERIAKLEEIISKHKAF